MSSTFLGLNTAYTGLQAANSALNTTSNNIANIETKGYSRQQVTTQAAEAIRAFTTYGCVGAGVETLAIERVRDQFYDQKYWSNQAQLGEYEVKAYYMRSIEDYYKDDDTINGFTTIFNDYTKSIQELAKNPSDIRTRQQMIGQAGNLATYFSDMYTNMQKMQDDVNQEIKVNVDRINSIAQEIAALNKQINVIEMNSGAMANDLRDQRDLLVDELSQIVNTDTEEQAVIDNRDTSRDTGGTRYIVKICGQVLVDASSFKSLTCVTRELNVKTNQTDINGLYDIYFSGDASWTPDDYRRKGDSLNVYGTDTSGKLAGLFQMRDGNNDEYFTGTVTGDIGTDADGNQTVQIRVAKECLIDTDKLNLTQAGGIIQIASQNYYFKDWSYSHTEGEDYAVYTITLDNSRNSSLLSPSVKGKIAEIGSGVNYQGIPYYLSQMNEWVRKYASAANDIVQDGVLDDDTPGHALFSGMHAVRGDELTLKKTDRVGASWKDAKGNTRSGNLTIKDRTGITESIEMDGAMTYRFGLTAAGKGAVLTDEDGTEYTVTAVNADGTGLTVSYEDADGNAQTQTITLTDTVKDVTLPDGTTTEKRLDRDDSYYMLTAGNFRVREEMEIDASLLATRREKTEVADGVEKNDVVTSLVKLSSDDKMMSFRGCSADQYLVCILGDVAMNTHRANNFEENYTILQKTIQNQRLSVFGVDNDEEAVNLSKYQQQYNLAAKMIQTLTEVYDRLILQTGV